MKFFSQKSVSKTLALFILASIAACGQEDLSVQQSYDNSIQGNSENPSAIQANVPEIKNITENYASNLTEATAESILKKDEAIQVAEQKKQEEKTIQESKSGSSVTTAGNVSASGIFSSNPPYVGLAGLPPSVKKFTLSLKRDPAFINKSFFEPSGLCFDDKGDLYTVADKGHYSLYKLDLSNPTKGYNATADVNFKKTEMLKLRLKKKNKFDFEGLAFHKGSFYAPDERDRKVFKLDRDGSLTDLNIDINGYMKNNGIRNNVENSGLEGLTIDSVNERMYLMKERQESAVLVIDMKTNKVINHFKVLLPGNVEPSLTDASFYNGALYVLSRSHRQVIKMNPDNGNILSIYDYRKFEEDPKNVYVKIPTFGSGNDPDGYGVMEGLAVTKDGIYIATDNNMLPLKRNMLNNKPQLFIFSNPE